MIDFEISWYGPHPGEEPPVSGSSIGGSGTIFFCRCNLKCVYCQNWQISQGGVCGRRVSGDELLKIMLNLQSTGCHNINLVSPTIWSSKLREVIKMAKKKGLRIPILWNSNGYETKESLKKLEGVVDIYLPDYKYSDEKLAVKYSNCFGYPQIAQEAILEMYRQVGDLEVNNKGLAQKGLIIRHLVLPGLLDNTKKCLEFIRKISEDIHLSLMSQYHPTYRASEFPEINRPLTQEEYNQVVKMVEDLGFKNGWVQEFGGSVKCLNPDFCKENPFN